MPDDLIKQMKIGRSIKPVVENPRLSLMGGKALRPRLIGGKRLLMTATPKPDTGKTGRMAPVSRKAVRVARPTLKRGLAEMKAKPVRTSAAAVKDGYVRIRLRVAGDRVTVVGAKAVEGPLVERPDIRGSMAYDVTLGSKRVAAGSILDVGERRSFPNESPRAPAEQRGHFITEVPTYEVNVRVPASEVKMRSLPRLNIRLYRVKEDVDVRLAKPGPLGAHFTRELREVGRVSGIKPATLAAPHRAQLKKALG